LKYKAKERPLNDDGCIEGGVIYNQVKYACMGGNLKINALLTLKELTIVFEATINSSIYSSLRGE